METLFYRGVVEDNNDPEKLGRLRVRIFGLHSDDKELLPTENLPWSEVAHSLEGGFISGIGKSYVAKQGTYVWCFLDGGNEDKAVVFASCPGISQAKEDGAFADPSALYPLDDRLGESDFNRLARGDKTSETPSETALKEGRVTGVSTADGSSWDEPASTSDNAKYPFNNVTETSSGHVIQIDDTQGNERIQIFHKSGAYVELKPDGAVVIKSASDIYEIAKGNYKQNVALKSDITVNADKSEMIGGALNATIGKDETIEIGGQHDLTVGKSSSISISESGLYNAGKDVTIKAGVGVEIKSTTSKIDSSAMCEIKGAIVKIN